jgi:uncharacterized protein YciI
MAYFIVTITYVKPMDEVESHTPAHREYSAQLAERGVLLASGPFSPRTGGMLIMQGESREAVDAVIADDPFKKESIADYEVREWVPKVGADRF